MTSALECNINELLDKPFDMYDSYKEILIENLEDIPQKYIKLTGKDLIDYREKSENSLEIFFCYLESLGYELTILNSNEMKQYHIEPNTEDDFYAGIEDKQRDNVTFFHRIEFENFQKELEKAIAYEIYKQYSKK